MSRWLRRGALALLLLVGIGSMVTGCSPLYLARAGWAEAKILAGRRPIPEVLNDSTVSSEDRGKLRLVWEARDWARDSLGIDVGEAYTTFTRLDRDTLALIVSAAHRDRLESKTWWFPIVGSVPYRGFFSLDRAESFRSDLENDGFDTYLRPTGAFSTLGWFNDPMLSTALRADAVGVVETVLHELAHRELWVPGRVTFNESYATWVGGVATARFFCGRPGGGPDTVWCRTAEARWRDDIRFSRFLDDFVADLREVYDDPERSYEEKLRDRGAVFERAERRYDEDVGPRLESNRYDWMFRRGMNNALLLSRIRYYHGLGRFQALRE